MKFKKLSKIEKDILREMSYFILGEHENDYNKTARYINETGS